MNAATRPWTKPIDLNPALTWDTGTFLGHVAFIDGGRSIVVSCGWQELGLRALDLTTHEERPFSIPAEQVYIRVATSPDGSLLTSPASPKSMILHVPTGDIVRTLDTPGDPLMPGQAEWSPDGKTLAIARLEQLYLWSVQTPGPPVRIAAPMLINNISFSPNGKMVLLHVHQAHQANVLIIYDVTSGRKIKSISSADDGALWGFFRDDKTLLVGYKNSLEQRDLATNSKRTLVQFSEASGNARLSADRRILLVGPYILEEGPLVVWNLKTRQRFATLYGAPKLLCGMDISSDGRTVAASAQVDGKVQVWYLPKLPND